MGKPACDRRKGVGVFVAMVKMLCCALKVTSNCYSWTRADTLATAAKCNKGSLPTGQNHLGSASGIRLVDQRGVYLQQGDGTTGEVWSVTVQSKKQRFQLKTGCLRYFFVRHSPNQLNFVEMQFNLIFYEKNHYAKNTRFLYELFKFKGSNVKFEGECTRNLMIW